MTRSRHTLTEVARIAGVSVATVSRVMANHPHVSEATRQRVRRAVEELRFDPEAPFVPRGSPMVGFLVPAAMSALGLNRAVYLTLVGVIREEVEARGYGLYVGTYSGEPDGGLVGDRVVGDRQIRGAIVSRIRADEEIDPFLAADVPVVVLNRPTALDGAYSVAVDNRRAATEAAGHLIELGHRRIGVLAGPPDVYSAAERLLGYRDGVRAAGLPADTLQVRRTDLAEADGRVAVEAFLDQPTRPTAIVAVNDYLALAAMDVAGGRGLRLPEDLSIVGFDDIEAARYVTPALTTVHMPWDRIGRWGARLLLDVLADRTVRRASVEMTTELIVRGSTAPPPGGAPACEGSRKEEVLL